MRRAIAIALLLAALAMPSAALGDGDPASDVLLLQDSYLPYQPAVPKPIAGALNATLKQLRKKGFPLRVAILASQNDMGSVPQFFGRPQPYAQFLQGEIAFNKPKPLLVVMPDGYGSAALGFDGVAALAGLKPPASGSGDALGRAAIEATVRLAKAAGKPVPMPALPKVTSGKGGGGGTSPAIIFGVPVLLLALGGGLAAVRARQTDKAAS
jgi:hypothetical protein